MSNSKFDAIVLEKVYAVAKAFENIGEAVKNIPQELTKGYPQIPWLTKLSKSKNTCKIVGKINIKHDE